MSLLRDLLLRLLQFSDQYNVSQKDVGALPVKAIVLSLKYVNRQALFSALYPDDFADWELAERTLSGSNTLAYADTKRLELYEVGSTGPAYALRTSSPAAGSNWMLATAENELNRVALNARYAPDGTTVMPSASVTGTEEMDAVRDHSVDCPSAIPTGELGVGQKCAIMHTVDSAEMATPLVLT